MSMLAVDNIKCFFSQKPLLSEVVWTIQLLVVIIKINFHS
jgi:hypothetical protein